MTEDLKSAAESVATSQMCDNDGQTLFIVITFCRKVQGTGISRCLLSLQLLCLGYTSLGTSVTRCVCFMRQFDTAKLRFQDILEHEMLASAQVASAQEAKMSKYAP